MCEPKVEDTDGIYDEEMYEDMGIEILSPNSFYNDQEIKPGWRKEDPLKKGFFFLLVLIRYITYFQ